MEDSKRDSDIFRWLERDDHEPIYALKNRRRSSGDFTCHDSSPAERRRSASSVSHESSSIVQFPVRQPISRKASTVSNGESPEISHSLPQRNSLNQVPERLYSAAEKRNGWSKGRHDSGVLTSFDSSQCSSNNNISSIDALLDERQVDAEDLLVSLGFAPLEMTLKLEHRVPGRFLRSENSNRSHLIERFISDNPEEFRDLLARRKFLQNSSNSAAECACDAHSDRDSNSACSHHSDDKHAGMISEEAALRLMNYDLPQRFKPSLLCRCGKTGMPNG